MSIRPAAFLRRCTTTKRQWLSTSSISDKKIMATVVQGPSLLLTSLHRPAPSLMLVPGLRSLPLWTSPEKEGINRVAYQDPTVTKIVNYLQEKAPEIREDYLRHSWALKSDYSDGGDNHLHDGEWDWHSFMKKGTVQADFCQEFQATAKILMEGLREHLFADTPFGFSFFSSLAAGSTIQPHCSPINFRLRIHLPLIVPSDGDVGIRVGPTSTKWVQDQAMVLDDSYEHEVWNKSEEKRVILLVDIWHPDVRPSERQEIIHMFQHAKEQGWLGDKTKK